MARILLPAVVRWNTWWSKPIPRRSLVPFPCSKPTFQRKLLIPVGHFSLNWPISSLTEIYQSIHRWSFSVRWIKYGNRFNVPKCLLNLPRPPHPPVHRRRTTTTQMKISTWTPLSIRMRHWTKTTTKTTRMQKQENAPVVAETNITWWSIRHRTVTTTINSKHFLVHNVEKWDRAWRWAAASVSFSSSRFSRLSTISFDICPFTRVFVPSSARYDEWTDTFCGICLSDRFVAKVFGKHRHSVDTRSFTHLRNPTLVASVAKPSIARRHWIHTCASTRISNHG